MIVLIPKKTKCHQDLARQTLKGIINYFQIMLMRRKHFDQSGKTEYLTSKPVASSTQHPGYAPNAALHAIKRHALEFVNPKELMVSSKTTSNPLY